MNRTVFGNWMVLAFAFAIAGAALGGCGSKGSGSVDVADAGSVGFALSLPGNATVDTVAYVLTGPNGYSSMGSFSVAGPGTTFTYTLPGIPAGAGYTIALTATSSDNRACKGMSMPFTVVARQSVNVSVVLSCEGKGTSGSIIVDGRLNICPVVDSAIAAPSSAAVGATIALNGSGTDEDTGPMALTYAWTATGTVGTITNGSSQNATFTCNAQGTSTVTLTVSDSDTQCTGNTLTVDVTCSGTGAGGAGTGAGGAGTGAAGTGEAGTGAAGTGAAGTGAAGTGAAGTGEAGTGAAGTGAAGTGAAGTGAAGTGAAGTGTGGTCIACEQANNVCNTRLMNCQNATGTVNGMPKSAVCQQVIDCVRAAKCTTAANGMYQPIDCFCGTGVLFDTCVQGSVSTATGACKDIIAAGAETTNVAEIGARFTDSTYATGLAFQLLQCDSRFCNMGQCDF